MISNTATPIYYGQFRDKVLRGEIPVCREISMQMNRIDAMIADPNLWYDDNAINGYIAFCENELTLTDGQDLTLLDSFKLWAEDLFAWFYFVEVTVPEVDSETGFTFNRSKIIKRRLRHKQYLIVGRGAAKSMYMSSIHGYGLVVDTSTTKQVTTAPTMKLAEEVMSPLQTAITRARGPVIRFLTEGSLQNTTGNRMLRKKLASTKNGIENFLTNSLLEIRAMTIRTLQGLRTKYNTVDEWLSGDIREDVVGALEQGASKVDDWIIVAASSEGTARNGPGDAIKMELMDILSGKYQANHVSVWYYKLDSVEEVGNPAMWMKANPNLGKTVSYEAYAMDVERAEKAPATRNDILAKRFGIPTEGLTYFFRYEETKCHPKKVYWNMACALGLDASQGDDFCAFTFLFPLPGGRFGVKTRSYITSYTYDTLHPALRVKYEDFLKEGSLIIMEGTVLSMEDVYDDLDAYIEHCQYDVRTLGYDRYNADYFVQRWIRENGDYGVEKVIQGSRTESVPLGELKHLAEQRFLIFDEELMSFTMGNCITTEDSNGNRKLHKKRREEKIDNVAALMDAYVSYKLHTDFFEI